MSGTPSSDARFRGLFDVHGDAMRAYCFRRLDVDDADEAVAEVFLTAWRKIDRAPEGEEARLWLFAIARNVVRNATRSRRRSRRLAVRLASLGQVPVPDPQAQVVRSAEAEELLAQVAKLRPLDRELLRLRTWEALSASEISVATGLSIRAVETRLSRIRKQLAHSLGPSTTELAAPRKSRPVPKGGEQS